MNFIQRDKQTIIILGCQHVFQLVRERVEPVNGENPSGKITEAFRTLQDEIVVPPYKYEAAQGTYHLH